MVMPKNMEKINVNQTFNIASHRTWFKCLLEDVKNFKLDMSDVVSLKPGVLKGLINIGVKANEERTMLARAKLSAIRHSKVDKLSEKKKAAQQAMKDARKASKLVGTKTTKPKKKIKK
jgi:hypothetical protein